MSIPLALELPSLAHVGMIALLLFGFGFVIFWHELGHFLAAKWVGIKVEQFAIGFGHAMVSWRKGIGFRVGNTQSDYRDKAVARLEAREASQMPFQEKGVFTDEQISAAADELGLGETEYRLNWIPLGGYVKMLGQDDMKPDAVAEDPRAYNKKSISARMLVISAGVIMNVILAAIGFMILFLMGFHVAPAWVGNMLANSPAQKAGLMVGDHILTFDGRSQDDFTKIMLNTALVEEGTPVTMVVDRPDTPQAKSFHKVTLTVTPARREQDMAFLAIGFEAPKLLQAPSVSEAGDLDLKKLEGLYPPEALALLPGDTIVAVNGQPVQPTDYVLFDKVVQQSGGKPITLTIKNAAGVRHDAINYVHFADTFNPPFNVAGMQPRVQVNSFTENSVARGDDKLHLNDVIVSIKSVDLLPHPTREQLMDDLNAAGVQDKAFDVTVLRDGKEVVVPNLKASIRLGAKKERRGIGVALIFDEKEPVIAGLVEGGPAKTAGLAAGDRILSVSGQPVKNWFDVQRLLSQIKPDETGKLVARVSYRRENVTEPRETTLTFSAEQLASVAGLRYIADVQEMGMMADFVIVRHTTNPIEAAKWGVFETRDFILQFYLTLRRMIGGSVSPSNMMGPVGIFIGGARFAFKGPDWLLWFLCMISANLAVVNFLPIPVVDGGQFMFLILEKIKGEPLSTRAMVIAQYVGLAFLAAVVLFVTYHDIMRAY